MNKPLVSQATIDEIESLNAYDARCMLLSSVEQGDFFTCAEQVGTLILLSDSREEWKLWEMHSSDNYAPCWNIDFRMPAVLNWRTEVVLEENNTVT